MSKETLVTNGFLKQLDDTTNFKKNVGESQGWWEGYAKGICDGFGFEDFFFNYLIKEISKRPGAV